MGKQQPTPPPQNRSSFEIPPPPPVAPETLALRSNDPDIQRVLDDIGAKQKARAEKAASATPGDMAFGMMRNVPREHWNTPLADLGHWPRGSSIAEVKKNPELRNFTPAQAIIKLFELDDAAKKKAETKK